MNREAWHVAVQGSKRVGHDWVAELTDWLGVSREIYSNCKSTCELERDLHGTRAGGCRGFGDDWPCASNSGWKQRDIVRGPCQSPSVLSFYGCCSDSYCITITIICCCLVAKSHPTLATPCSSVCGIIPAGILESVAISFSRGSSQPRNPNHIFCIGRRILYHWATWEVLIIFILVLLAYGQWLSETLCRILHRPCLILSPHQACSSGLIAQMRKLIMETVNKRCAALNGSGRTQTLPTVKVHALCTSLFLLLG